MLLHLLAALVAAASWVGYRGSSRSRSRAKPRPLLVTALLLIAAFGLFAEAGHRQSQDRYSVVAQYVSGRPEAVVACQRLSGGLLHANVFRGWVEFRNGKPSKTAHLDWRTCQDLRSAERALDKNPAARLTTEQMNAIHVLTHESIHLTGVSNEAATECIAIQHDETTARMFGVPDDIAATLPGRYLVETYAYMPDDYRSNDCVEDGALDQSPTDGTWPGASGLTADTASTPADTLVENQP